MSHDLESAVAREAERRATEQRLAIFLGSHDAAASFVRDSVDAKVSPGNLIDTARRVAQYADDAIAIVNDEYRPRLECKEGCSYCCCKPGVLTSIPELLRILEYVQTLPPRTVEAIQRRAEQYVRKLAGRHFDAAFEESVPCPLLSDGRCSAYDVRPLTCRGYNSTSVDACRRAHATADPIVPIFAPIKDVTDGATVGAAMALREFGVSDSLVDLGTALNIALGAGGGFAEEVAEGCAALNGARNTSWVKEMWTQVSQIARHFGLDVETA